MEWRGGGSGGVEEWRGGGVEVVKRRELILIIINNY